MHMVAQEISRGLNWTFLFMFYFLDHGGYSWLFLVQPQRGAEYVSASVVQRGKCHGAFSVFLFRSISSIFHAL